MATGHYVQKREIVSDDGVEYQLVAGLDPNKDQSYFLCQLNQFQLSKALFPIGGLLKPEVRKIAEQQQLVTASKKILKGCVLLEKLVCLNFYNSNLK